MCKENEVSFSPSWDPSCILKYKNKIEFKFHISDFLLEGSQIFGKAILLGDIIGKNVQIIKAPGAIYCNI